MSLFLIYFEIGKPVPPSSIPAPICHFPITLAFMGRSGPPRQALVLTDGGSSGAFLAFGNKVVAREGEVLRKSLLQFIRQRLSARANPHLVVLWFDGPVASATIDIDRKTRILLDELEDRFRTIKPSEVIEVADDSDLVG